MRQRIRRLAARAREARAQTLVMFALMITVFCLMVALALDMSIGYYASSVATETAEQTKEVVFANLQNVKYSATPQDDIAQDIIWSLKEGGYEGKVDVWIYEVPESSIATSQASHNRLIGVYVMPELTTNTLFGVFAGIASMTENNELAYTVNPYSSKTIYRPSNVEQMNVHYTVDMTKVGDTAAAWRSGITSTQLNVQFSSLPSALRSVIIRDLDTLSGGLSSSGTG